MVPKLGERLRRAIVVGKQAAESLLALDWTGTATEDSMSIDQAIAKPRMISLVVIVLDIFADDAPEVAFAERNHLADAL